MRRVSRIAGLIPFALGIGAWVAAGFAAPPSLRLACNDFPPHKIEHRDSGGLAGFDVDIITEALRRGGRLVPVSYMP